VFCVVLLVGLRVTTSNFKTENSAKSEYLCHFYIFYKTRGAHVTLFYEMGASFKKGWESMF